MHEFAICQSLLQRADELARAHGAHAICSLKLAIGPLSGVEGALLTRAFSVARCGTLAEAAELEIEVAPVRVRCRTCRETTEATANRLLCGACGEWKTDLVSGDEMTLMSMELETGDGDDV